MEQLVVSEEGAARAAVAGFSVALVLHTTRSDWSKLQVAGIRATLEHYQAELMEVVECGFQPERQVAALDRLLELEPDAIISVPVGIVQVADRTPQDRRGRHQARPHGQCPHRHGGS